jgi:large subunit ribosomal protein LP2
MRHLAVYLMLQLGGNASPSKEDITTALSAVGVESDAASLYKMMAELEGKSIEELLDAGKDMLATFGGGGGGGGAAAGGGGDAAAAPAAAKEEEKEEEEVDMGGGMDMFGGEEGGGGGGDY